MMTEKELFGYIGAVRSYRRAQERVWEFEAGAYSASAPNLTQTPPQHSYDSDKAAVIADRLSQLRKRELESYKRLAYFEELMIHIEGLLKTEAERDFLQLRYRKGLTISAIARRLHRSRSSLYRDREQILEKIADIKIAQ